MCVAKKELKEFQTLLRELMHLMDARTRPNICIHRVPINSIQGQLI